MLKLKNFQHLQKEMMMDLNLQKDFDLLKAIEMLKDFDLRMVKEKDWQMMM